MKINSVYGYWENEDEEGHGTDRGLAVALSSFFYNDKTNSIWDFGCGNGFYTKHLFEGGFDVRGLDGNPHTREIAGQLCSVANLAEELTLEPRDWVLSLEVAEHIPADKEKVFINNVDKYNTKGVIISWSIPEFGGDGHFNPRPNYEVEKIFQDMGYTIDKDSTKILRTSCAYYPNPCWWFGYTIFVFRR